MPQQPTVAHILQIAPICQFLAANDTHKEKLLKGVVIDSELAKIIYIERTIIQYVYDLDPSNSTLVDTSLYLYRLLGKYINQAEAILAGQTQAPPLITNPANVSINVGQSATFAVTVISTLAYTVQWYRNGVAIPGATSLTYTLTNAQTTDSGALFSAKATSAAGSATSLQATLTVTALIQWFAFYGPSDPYPNLSIGLDNLAYQLNGTIAHNSPITVTWPLAAANNQYEVLKVPTSESIKIAWFNTPLNQGTIPDAVFRTSFGFGGYTYYVSRNAMSLDSTTLTETFS